MKYLGVTTSACEDCRKVIPAKIVTDGTGVFFRKFCPEHGESESQVYGDVGQYLLTQRYVKPAWVPETFQGDARVTCPDGCGFCARHEQHLCMPIVEITSRCNMACPICINASGGQDPVSGSEGDMSLDTFRGIIGRLIASEKQIDLLNISGGEPLLHPLLTDMIDEALSHKEVVRVSVSTNGLVFLGNPALLDAIRERNAVVSLQFDGLDDGAYAVLRGRPLRREKMEVLEMLDGAGVTTSLVMTLAKGVNEHQIRYVLDCLFGMKNVVSLMIQPLAFAGRATVLRGKIGRLTIPDVVRLLARAGHRAVGEGDFVPLPCSHPLCFTLAFYLMMEDGGSIPISKLTDAATFMDSLANRAMFGLDADEHAKVRNMIYDLWSGPAGAVPDGDRVLKTLRSILRELSASSQSGCFDPRKAFTVTERRVKSIFIHAFQDAGTFDLNRVRRCCQAYPQPDGRLLPVCVRNVLGTRQPGG